MRILSFTAIIILSLFLLVGTVMFLEYSADAGQGHPEQTDPGPGNSTCVPIIDCGVMCGMVADGCGGEINCGECPTPTPTPTPDPTPDPTPTPEPTPDPTPLPPPPVITSFTATPNPIIRGQTSTLSWESEDATVCNGFCVSGPCAEWGPSPNRLPTSKATSGTQVVRPLTTAVYRLECLGYGGRVRQDLTVRVDFIRWREVIPRLFPFLDQMFAWVSGTRMQEAK